MLQARHDIDLGLVSQQCFRLAQVGVRSRDITGLVWLRIEYRRTSQRRFQKANEREQRHGVGASQVENLIGAWVIFRVGAISRHGQCPLRYHPRRYSHAVRSVTKDRNRLSSGHQPRKLVDSEVGTLIGPIHRKKAQTCDP